MSAAASLKVPPARDEVYKDYIRQHPCALHGNGKPCQGEIQAAHVPLRGEGRMGGKASDYYCAPLCAWHHIEYLHRGHATQEEVDGIQLFAYRLLVRFLDWRRTL